MRTNIRFPLRYVTPRNSLWERITGLEWWAATKLCYRVQLSKLIGVQAHVTVAGVRDVCWPPMPIYVVKIGNKHYIRDGHHRVTRALQAGKKTILAAVIEL